MWRLISVRAIGRAITLSTRPVSRPRRRLWEAHAAPIESEFPRASFARAIGRLINQAQTACPPTFFLPLSIAPNRPIVDAEARANAKRFVPGIGTVFENVGRQTRDNIRQQLEDIFHRDWYSDYSFPLNISETRLENAWSLSRSIYQHSSHEPYIHA